MLEDDVVIPVRVPDLFVFAHSIGLGTEIGGGRAGLGEVPSKHGVQEGSEDELGTAMKTVSIGRLEMKDWDCYLKAGSDSQSKKTNLNV